MAADEDYQSLVRGVASLSFTGDAVPCKLLLTGPCAFPVLVSPRKDVLIAASRYGKGKVVVLAHEGYLSTQEFMGFLKNAVSWLRPNPDAVIGIHTTLPVLAHNLSGYKIQNTSTLIQGLGVFCTNGYEAHQAEEIISFVRGGGGLLIGAQAWHWSYSHKENVLHHFPGNKIISVCGVHFTSEYGEKGDFWVTDEMPQVAVCTDYQSLVRGVASLSFTGDPVPCKLLLRKPTAFPVLVSPRKDVLIAASHYGKGKVVVLAHEGYLNTEEFMAFLKNAVSWLSPNSDAVIGVHTTLPVLANNLSGAGYKVRNTSTLIQGLGVFCTNGYEAHQAEEIISFVRGGGGLLIGAQAWHWSYSHKENVLHHFPGNKIISVCGVHFTSEYGEKGDFWVTDEMPQVAVCTDYQSLVRGVASLSFTGDPVPCKLLLRKPTAFPVLVSPRKDVLIAASHYGKGKVVVLAHEGYLNTEEFMAFLKNAVSWLSPNSDAVIGVHTTLPVLANNLSGAGYKVRNTSTLIQGLGVFCTNGYEAHQAEEIISFVRGGGGLLIGAQAWHWSYSHKENNSACNVLNYPGNKILNRFGISILCRAVPQGIYWAVSPNEASHQNNCHRALHHLQVALKSGTKLLQPISTRMRKLRQNVSAFMRHSACCVPKVSKTCPVSGCSEEALLLSLAHKSHNMSHKCDDLSILEKEPSVTVNIDATNPGADAWRSTGLYLPPRKAVVIEFPASAVQQGFQVQVGCHSDDPSAKETLNRAPVVVRRIHVDRQKVPVSSFWGGLLYIIVRSNSNFGTVPVRVYGAEPAPIYIKGKTSLDSWLHSIRQLPAPWAELVTENIILTVPSDAVRSLKNPEALLSLWDRIMAAIADLAAKPKKFPRPERIVADVQISAGWMHAGYPIMCDLESAKELTDLHHMEKEGIWGPIHELGHNQQKTQWEFPPHTTEATCNLWAVYVHETVLGIPRDRAHGNLQPNVRTSRIKSYLQNGANLEQWDGWTALETYLQLQEGLGWDPFRRLYRDPSISGMSNENTFKMNLWAEKFSRAAQTNLVPFFEAWGWPIDQSTRSKLSALPVWEKDPMKPYVTAKKSV
uniref:Peptidase M60 domain-containing protein n=1 Tax=Xenopus tropicalis TaxID=8364 RepID=A0A1B8Y3J9_XENTR